MTDGLLIGGLLVVLAGCWLIAPPACLLVIGAAMLLAGYARYKRNAD